MDYLDDIYFDNSLRSILLVTAIILFAFITKRIISRIIASLIFISIKKISGSVQKKSFLALVVRPLELFMFLTVLVSALNTLVFPIVLKFSIYSINSRELLKGITAALLILSFTWLILRVIDFIAMVMEEKANLTLTQSDNQLIIFFKDFLKVIIVIIGCVLILKFSFDARIGELITGLSLVGAALALAARESLENLIASFIIFVDKPFTAGDLVKVQNFLGHVERIGLRSTRIRTFDMNLITVPNKQMVDSILDNWSMRTALRMEIKLEISPKTPASKIEDALHEIKKILQPKHTDGSSSSVYVSELTKNGAMVIVDFFTHTGLAGEKFNELRQEIILEIKKMLEEKEINLMGSATTNEQL